MLYELSQSPLPFDFELDSAVDTSLPSSTFIDDERDTEHGTDAFGTCFEELSSVVWRCVVMLGGVTGFLSTFAVRLAFNATR
jgi:hypothetical protein